MAKKFTVKNPGCQYCRYYLKSFSFNGSQTQAGCTKQAKKVVRPRNTASRKRAWKWIRCRDPIKYNGDRLCDDFQIHSFFLNLATSIHSKLFQLGEQQPPAFSGEKWWDT